jgi:hypothetical protein
MILAQNEGWLVSNVADEILMLSIESGEYVGLNASGAIIWELLETPKSTEQLIDLLVEQFDVGREQAKQDIDSFLEAAFKRGIVVQQ